MQEGNISGVDTASEYLDTMVNVIRILRENECHILQLLIKSQTYICKEIYCQRLS